VGALHEIHRAHGCPGAGGLPGWPPASAGLDPDLLHAAEDEDISVPVKVKIHMDNKLLQDIVQRVKDLREREELAEYGYYDDDDD
jgi:hypothetical protein